MESIEAISSIAQLGGTALAIAVLIYVLIFFRNEVKTNKEDLAKFIENTLTAQKEMQKEYLDNLALERANSNSQESYIRELTKDMIGVLNTNNGHLQKLIQESEVSRKDIELILKSSIDANNKSLQKRLLIIAKALQIDASEFIE